MEKQGHMSLFERAKPFMGVIFLQFGFAGMDVLSKAALNQGMSNYVFVVYRHAVAFIIIAPFALILDKKVRPKMTFPIFIKIVLLSLLEPVIDQNLYFLGMKYTTATFAAAMSNIVPAITFIMASIIGLEKVKIKRIRSQAKVFGTAATVAGAMVMTLVKGPVLEFISGKGTTAHESQTGGAIVSHSVKGSLMLITGCFSWACFMVLQAITLKSYPAELSLTAWICLLGTLEGSAVAIVMERGNPKVWSLKWGVKLMAALYSGIVCSGLAYYIQGVVMKDRGPVFVTAFSPLGMVVVAIMSSFILSEQMYLGRVIGATIIVAGLYLVVWGKSKDHAARTPPIDVQIAPVKEPTEEDCNRQNDSSHEVITVSFDAGLNQTAANK